MDRRDPDRGVNRSDDLGIPNRDVLEGKWKQLRGKVKERWNDLTDDDLDRAAGSRDRLAGVIQERYGHTRERVDSELDALLEEDGDTRGSTII